MLLGQIPFAGSAAAEGIDQAEALVELRVCAGGRRGESAKRLEELAPGLAFWVGPDGNRVEPWLDKPGEWGGGVCRGHSPGHAATDGWEGIADAVQHELEQGVTIWLPVCQEKAGGLSTFDGRVSLRLTEAQRGGELVIGEIAGDGQFDRDDEVLGFELHSASIRSLFANSEHH